MDLHEEALESSSFNLLATIFSWPRFITQTVTEMLLSCTPPTSMEGSPLRSFSCKSFPVNFTLLLSHEIVKVGVMLPKGGTKIFVVTPLIGFTSFSIWEIPFSHFFHSLS